MDIHDAARYFDQDPINDGYTSAYLFDAQTASFDDSHSDGSTFRRRVLSVAPGLSVPDRRVLSIYGDLWITGTGTPDGFLGAQIRQHYNMKRVTDLVQMGTPGEMLASAGCTSCYVNKTYFKDVSDTVSSSETTPFWNIFVAPVEEPAQGLFMQDASGELYRIRQTYLPVEGLVVCQSDALNPGSRGVITYETGVYLPVSDSYSTGTTILNAINLPMAMFYRFNHSSDPIYKAGDVAVLVSATVTPKTNDKFTMNGIKWYVVQAQRELDAWVLHARLA